jgi:hypothetical protein
MRRRAARRRSIPKDAGALRGARMIVAIPHLRQVSWILAILLLLSLFLLIGGMVGGYEVFRVARYRSMPPTAVTLR